MGYTTDFTGAFTLNKQLQPNAKKFLTHLATTRRMKRNLPECYGIDGEFQCEDTDNFGQNRSADIVDYNCPPSTQPGLWLQWIPNEDGTAIEWDGNEKFYEYTAWLTYLIAKILAPNGYVLNGTVEYQGERVGDNGEITIKDNVVYLDGNIVEPDSSLRTDITWLETQLELPDAII